MELQLHGFRCYTDKTFLFPSKGIVLLNGPSGAGKTTILQAVTWCLYGKIRNVESKKNSKSKKMYVRLIVQASENYPKKIEIYRQKHPNLLKVSIGILEFTGEVAQNRIEGWFGSEVIWNLSSYLRQHQFNPLFSSSAAGGLQYLNAIAFQDQDPSLYIDHIRDEWKTVQTQFEVQQDLFAKNCEAFKTYLSEHSIHKEYACSKESLQEQCAALQELKDVTLPKTHQAFLQHQQASAKIECLTKEQEDLRQELAGMDQDATVYTTPMKLLTDSSSRKSVELLLEGWCFTEKEIQKLETKIQEQTCVLEEMEEVEPMDESEYYALVEKHETLVRHENTCEKYSIAYDRDLLQQRVTFIQALRANQRALEMYDKMMEIYDFVKDMPHHPDFKEEKITEYETKILEEKQSLTLLRCPSCAQTLRYHNRCLESVDAVPSSQESLAVLIEELETLRRQDKENKVRQKRVDQFNHYKALYMEEQEKMDAKKQKYLEEKDADTKRLTAKENRDLEQECKDLERVLHHYIEKEGLGNVEEAKSRLQKKKGLEEKEALEKEHQKVRQEHQTYRENVSSLFQCDLSSTSPNAFTSTYNREIKDYDYHVQHKQYIQEEYETVSQTITTLQEQIKDSAKDEWENCQKQIRILEEELAWSKDANEAMTKKQNLSEERESIVALSEQLEHLTLLKNLAVDTECQVLAEVVQHINSTVNVLSEDIFTDPIDVRLKLYKEVKSKKKLTPKVNFSIRYKTGEFSSPQEVSGGEQSRLSLLFTLALHRWNNTKVLMLDETFSSLDQDIKIECLRSIRKTTPHSLVLCVDHTHIEGYYDQTIHI
jgi:DNA repair exonuclease SbcCD ATPase subunit